MIIETKKHEYLIKRFEESKYASEFSEQTPEGNSIEGYILLSRDYYHGSLLIESVNNEDTLQFIHGFPKIETFERRRYTEFNDNIQCIEKVDGTCVGLYKLYDNTGKVLEYVTKSRQQAVLDPHFQSLFNQCGMNTLTSNINKWDCLFFEMFGKINPHTIKYDNIVNLRLIGAVTDDNPYRFILYDELKEVSDVIDIEMPNKLASISKSDDDSWKIKLKDDITLDKPSEMEFKNMDDIIVYIMDLLDDINDKALQVDNKLKYEGVVLQNANYNSTYDYYFNEYIKCKPETFMNFNKKKDLPVSKTEIEKEVHKIIDENYTEYLESYNEKDVIDEINLALSEEFDEKDIADKKVQGLIKNKLHNYIDVKTDIDLDEIATKYIERYHYNSNNIGCYLKIFVREYPIYKHHSNNMYKVLKERLE